VHLLVKLLRKSVAKMGPSGWGGCASRNLRHSAYNAREREILAFWGRGTDSAVAGSEFFTRRVSMETGGVKRG
jgi:hypothetical protein